MLIPRSLKLPQPGEENFFLWGPRQAGKTTLLEALYPEPKNRWFDLNDREVQRNLQNNPENVRLALDRDPPPDNSQVVIDEIQEIPELLSEIHLMIEKRGYKFALCGSSNRKLARGNFHMLGGRAFRYTLRGLTSHELGENFNLQKIVNQGYMPSAYFSNNPRDFIRDYIDEYLLIEIIKEAAVRHLRKFEGFLEAAALRDGRPVNFSNIAAECKISDKTVHAYYEILEDTYLGSWLPLYQKKPKGGSSGRGNFYFSDVGLVNHLARRSRLIEGGSTDFGKAFENWVFHELSTYIDYHHRGDWDKRLSYWKLNKTADVDFLIGDRVAIEAKSSERITGSHTKGLRSLAAKHPSFETLIVVSREEFSRQTNEGIQILNYKDFTERLWAGEYTESRLF